MEKILNFTFDFFAYAIPGICIITPFFILDPTLTTARDFLALAGQLQVGSSLMLLIIGYGVGFAITPLGRFLYKSIGVNIKNLFYKNLDFFDSEINLNISEKFVIVRELTPSNFKYIETFNMLSIMSHNFVVSTIVIFVLSLIKFFRIYHTQEANFWIGLAIFTLILTILFLLNAVKFHTWAINDLNAAIKSLKLINRVENIDKEKKEQKKD